MMYLGIMVGMIYLGEIGGYFWHRYAAHELEIPQVKESHAKHHTIINDTADEDFLYILGILIFLGIFLYWLYYIKQISLAFLASIYIPLFLVSVWSYYVHRAYHIENH